MADYSVSKQLYDSEVRKEEWARKAEERKRAELAELSTALADLHATATAAVQTIAKAEEETKPARERVKAKRLEADMAKLEVLATAADKAPGQTSVIDRDLRQALVDLDAKAKYCLQYHRTDTAQCYADGCPSDWARATRRVISDALHFGEKAHWATQAFIEQEAEVARLKAQLDERLTKQEEGQALLKRAVAQAQAATASAERWRQRFVDSRAEDLAKLAGDMDGVGAKLVATLKRADQFADALGQSEANRAIEKAAYEQHLAGLLDIVRRFMHLFAEGEAIVAPSPSGIARLNSLTAERLAMAMFLESPDPEPGKAYGQMRALFHDAARLLGLDDDEAQP